MLSPSLSQSVQMTRAWTPLASFINVLFTKKRKILLLLYKNQLLSAYILEIYNASCLFLRKFAFPPNTVPPPSNNIFLNSYPVSNNNRLPTHNLPSSNLKWPQLTMSNMFLLSGMVSFISIFHYSYKSELLNSHITTIN